MKWNFYRPSKEEIEDHTRVQDAKEYVMKCPCGYQGKHHEAEVSGGNGSACIIMEIDGRSIGKIDLYVCPVCGVMRTDANGNIKL